MEVCIAVLVALTVLVLLKLPLIEPAVLVLLCVLNAVLVADTVSDWLVVVWYDVEVDVSDAVVVLLPWIDWPVWLLELVSWANTVAVVCCV